MAIFRDLKCKLTNDEWAERHAVINPALPGVTGNRVQWNPPRSRR